MILVLVLWASVAQATSVYRWVDDKGNVVFGDQPPEGTEARQVEIPPANVMRAPPPRISADPSESENGAPGQDAAPDYQQIAIIYPEAESAIRQNAGNLTVRVELTPGLRQGDSLELLMDGNPVATSTTGQFDLTNVYRGTHTLTTRVVDKSGRSLIESEPVRFTMLRFSALFR